MFLKCRKYFLEKMFAIYFLKNEKSYIFADQKIKITYNNNYLAK